jgi:hypothetical protein
MINALFNLSLWLITRTQLGCYAVMGESLGAAYVVLALIVIAIVGGLGWLIVAYLSVKGLIGFFIGAVFALLLYPRANR